MADDGVKHISELIDLSLYGDEMSVRMSGMTTDEWRLKCDRKYVDDFRKGIISLSSCITSTALAGRIDQETRVRTPGLAHRYGLMFDDTHVVQAPVYATTLTPKERENAGSLKTVVRHQITKEFHQRAIENVMANES